MPARISQYFGRVQDLLKRAQDDAEPESEDEMSDTR